MKNPLNLSIGDKVIVSQHVEFYYNLNNVKELHKIAKYPSEYIITGVTRKAVGKYHPGGYCMDLDGGYHEPATFTASEYYTVYECKKDIGDKPIYVLPEDMDKV